MHSTIKHYTSHPKRRGFTLIELLVVVLVLSILMAVSTTLYLQAIAYSQRRVCRSNMFTISNAVHAAKVKNIHNDYSSYISGGVNPSTLPDLIGNNPICPSGGTYNLEVGRTTTTDTFKVRCSLSVHSTFEPNVDSN